MEFSKFVEWAFLAIISGAAVIAVGILSSLKNSVNELNQKIATIIEKVTWHEKWLERHDDEITNLREK